MGGPEKGRFLEEIINLSTESVEGASLSLEGVDDVQSGDGLALGVLSVGHRVTDDVLEKDLEDTAGLFVNETRNTLHSTSTGQSANGGFSDTLDVITQNLAVTLRAAFSKSFSSFASS